MQPQDIYLQPKKATAESIKELLAKLKHIGNAGNHLNLSALAEAGGEVATPKTKSQLFILTVRKS